MNCNIEEVIHLLRFQPDFINQLTNLERDIFNLYLQQGGVGYKEIAEQLDESKKVVDNAMQRVFNKLRSK